MPWKPYVEFANFICKFGDNTNLLDLANDVVVPAFLDHPYQYVYMSSTYFLYETKLMRLDLGGTDELCIVGQYIQNTTIKSRQTFDEAKGLIEQAQEMPSATSAVFVLVLSTHKLLYYHQTPGAPGIGTFKTVVERNIRQYFSQYVKDAIGQRIAEIRAQGIQTKTGVLKAARSVRQALPRMTLEILPLTSEKDFAAFVRSLHLLTAIRVGLVDTNDENDPNEFFRDFREQKDAVGATTSEISHSNPSGLNKDVANAQLAAAAADGNSRINLIGRDESDNPIVGDASNFKTKVYLPVADGIRNIVSQICTAFQDFRQGLLRDGIQIDEAVQLSNIATTATKIAAITERYEDKISNG